MMPIRRKSPLVCQLSKLLPAFCLFGFSLLLLAQGEWTSPNRIGLVQDWSTHHAVFPRNGPLSAMLAAQHDPRAFYSWRVAALDAVRTTSTSAAQTETAVDERHRANLRMSNRDWSISLGSAGTAGAMYPAKFTFDSNATPSCANDFVVFPANQSPNATHENLVAFSNLYSGNVNSFGICNRTTSASDNGLAATVKWSYAVSSSIAAGVSTSPALSLNGTKVAFVESKSGSQPHFHVLAWKSGDGVNAANKQDAQSPKVLSTFTASAPVAGSGTATDLAFGVSGVGSGDTLSSPFVDYGTDKAYIGDDKGKLVRIQDVFCQIAVNGGVAVNPDCTGVTPPAPSIDTTWGTAGTVSVPCGAKLTGPVVDFMTGNVFVGCSNGNHVFLYGTAFDASRNVIAGTPANGLNIHSSIVECSPLTEIMNSGTDRLFLSLVSGTLGEANINTFPTSANAFITATETGGTSGIIVDNVGSQGHASSIYFTTLGGSHSAVKLTQSALQ